MAIRFEVAQDCAFDGCFGVGSRQKPGEFFHAFLLKRAHSRSDGATQDGSVEFIFLSTAGDGQTFRLEPLRLVLNREFARFAGEFSGGPQFVEPRREAF